MKTKYLFGAMAALMMTACSQDEVVSIQQDGIAYSVSAGMQTRAADSYCNNILPGYFKVWAKSSDGLYINGDKIVNNGGVWTDEDGTRYWPDGKPLDFYAEVNGDKEFSFNDGAPSFNDFTVEDDVTKQCDLMYSVRKAQTKSVDKVQLNFRHALSQVCFKAKNNTKNMSVVIKGVSVGYLTNKGTFTFPTTDTDYNYVHHNDNANDQTLNGGTWTIPTDAQYDKQYDVTPLNGDVTLAPGIASNLTCPEDQHVNGFSQVLTLLPQTVGAWNPKNTEKKYDGAYFLLDLVLSNIVKGDTDADVSTTIYEGKAAVPVSVAWKQGYRYIYTFVFDEGGNGGWTPYPDDPKPVLTTIKYDVTVDDFIPANGDGNGTGMDTGDHSDYTDYVLTYDANGGAFSNGESTATDKTRTTDNESEFIVKTVEPTREGYTFLGWADTQDAEKANIKANDKLTLKQEAPTKTIYAVWQKEEKENEFKLIFNGVRDGVQNVPNALTYSGTEDSHEFIVPETNDMTCGNYEFKGWADTEKVESLADVKYHAGDKITVTKDSPSKTIYAVWGTPAGVIVPPPATGEDW